MPKSLPGGINYSEEQLAKKRAVVLEFLEKQKTGRSEKKKSVAAKPAVVLPAKPVAASVINFPKTEKTVLNTTPVPAAAPAKLPTAAAPHVEPISQFLGVKNQPAPLEVDFLEDVKKEKLAKPEAPITKQPKKNKKPMRDDKPLATEKGPKIIQPRAVAEPKIATPPRVDLLEDIKNETAKKSGLFQMAELFAILMMISLAFYLLISLYFFTFKPNSAFFRSVARVVPVPGLVSSYGFVEFYQYLDLKAGLQGKGAPEDSLADIATSASVEWQILEQLAKYYQLPPTDSAATLLNELGKAVVSDKEINAAAFSTIRKIKQEIATGINFETAAAKHGAKSAKELFAPDDAVKKFGPGFASLSDGAMSSIIVSSDGFYIVQKVGSSGEAIEASYVLVKPKTLSDIVDERLLKARAINFVQ